MNKILSVQRPANKHLKASQGFTLLEALVTLALIGVLATLLARPVLFAFSKPLQNATNQVLGILKQTRMRAIATTTAYRVRLGTGSETDLVVEAATSRGCGSTALLTQARVSTDTTLRVSTVRGFIIGDQIKVGSDTTNNNIIGIDSAASMITLGAQLGTSQPIDSEVELVNNWRIGQLITGFSDEDLNLPEPRSAIFGTIQQSPDEEVRLTTNPASWRLCFDSRGSANLINPATGNTLTQNLVLTLRRFNTATSANVGLPSVITVLPGGSFSFSYNGNSIQDTTAIKE